MDSVNKVLTPVFNMSTHPVTLAVAKLFILMYLVLFVPALPAQFQPVFDSVVVRLVVLSLVAYYSVRDPVLAVLIAVVFYVSMNLVQGKAAFEKFQSMPIGLW